MDALVFLVVMLAAHAVDGLVRWWRARRMSEPLRITFPATVYKCQTLVDKGLRVTLDLPEGCIEAAALLMMCQARGVVLEVEAVEEVQQSSTDGSSKAHKRTAPSPLDMAGR